MTVLAVIGLRREARIVGREGIVAVTGALLAGAPEASAVISIAIAGALASDLAVGDIVIAERVVTANDAYETDGKWTARMAALLPDAMLGAILGRSAIADTADVKAALQASSGAVAVDMESHLAARAAKARGVPFAALRVISDTADRSLPPAALVAMKPDGAIALGRVLWSVAANPAQIPALIRTGRDSESAFAALARCAAALGPGLGRPG